MLVYKNATIYHHSRSFFIPLLIFDPNRGLYVFEFKKWSYDELSRSKIQKATNQSPMENNLAFEKAGDIINKRFNELIHSDGVSLYNYLILENLTALEHENLDDAFKELLPSDKIIFNDSCSDTILEKLHNSSKTTPISFTSQSVIGSLLAQYAIVNDKEELDLCDEEQINFIDSDIFSHSTLVAQAGSGATSVLLLKAILEKLKNKNVKIIIIKPTLLACDVLRKRLLETIERAIIEIDVMSIEILTPSEVINRHLLKLSEKPLPNDEFYIDPLLIKKKVLLSDIILCDDANLLPHEFITYLKRAQEKSSLLLVGDFINEKVFTLQNSFRLKNQEREFLKTNPYAKAMQLVLKLLQTNEAKDIMIVSNSLNKLKLNEDLKSFIENKAILLDSSKNLIDQDLDNLLLAEYHDVVGINAKLIILMDVNDAPREYLNYAFTLCDEKVYVLYKEESPEIEYLKGK